ncbi:MAG TPA: precorrin-6y C5,15-methyltransferase (decarboxylating) subunit CbiE [Solirubrobacteraceae bacterium]|nr:precorrin-6y C5,15-methyltransferase (decarboxylating) subunit CbiE [Solirubrobacteraceae bacterium]
MSGARITVVGIGADGWDGLGESARAAILGAEEVIGSERQLAMLPAAAPRARPLPSPLGPLLDELSARSRGNVCVLASGDPMLHGIGATLARRVGPERLQVIGHPSAFSLACARLGWPAAEVELVSTVAVDPARVARLLQPGRRLIVFATGADGAARVAGVVRDRGFGASRFIVLEQLGGERERVLEETATSWGEREADPLHAIAIECAADPGATALPLTPGLPDEAYAHDGQLTKRHVRALTIAALAPLPGELLWDVGAGTGSISIEWLRVEPRARALAIEQDPERAQRIAANATALGVPELAVLRGVAPDALAGLDTPDAVFIGGGVTTGDTLERCWEALAYGGRIVANAVTLEGEARIVEARWRFGGELLRIELAHAAPIGGFTGWRAQMPVVQWTARK